MKPTVIHFDPADQPTASVLIVGWRRAPLLVSCLRSLLRSAPTTTFEVLIALNEPEPALLTQLAAEVEGARLLQFRTNLGFGGAVNEIAKLARGEFLVLLNDDCEVEPGWLDELVELVRRRERCGLVGSKFLHPNGELQEAGSVVWADGSTSGVGDGQPDGCFDFERRVDYCSGGSLLVRRDVWQQLGGFSDAYYPAYYEDVDLCLRADGHGWSTWYQPQSRVRHLRSASTTDDFKRFISRRNALTFCSRWSTQLAHRAAPQDVERAIWIARGSPLRVLIIDDLVPDPAVGSGFGRIHQTLLELGDDPTLAISFHPVNGPSLSPYQLGRHGVRLVVDLWAHLATPGVAYDVVVLSRPHNAMLVLPRLQEMLPEVPVVYDAEALYYRRFAMRATLAASDDERDDLLRSAQEMRTEEHRLLRAVDAVVCVSVEEAAEVRSVTDAPVHVMGPWLIAARVTAAPFEAREHIGFVAGWLAGPGSPNSDALLWFADQVLPLVLADAPGCRLLVTGADPPSEVAHLAGDAVQFVGKVDDIADFYERIRVAVSPTRFGAGVKIKTVEAIRHGVPVACTSEAVAGLGNEAVEVLTPTDDPQRLADAIVGLLHDAPTWQRRRAAQLALVDRFADRDAGSWATIVRQVAGASAGRDGSQLRELA